MFKILYWKALRLFKIDSLALTFTAPKSKLRKYLLPRSKAYENELTEIRLKNKARFILNKSDFTQWRIFAGELFINRRIIEFLTSTRRVDEELVIMDIGANIGGYTALLSDELRDRKLNIHLFEPNPAITPLTEQNLKLAKESSSSLKYVMNKIGLGDKTATLKLSFDAAHSGAASFNPSEEGSQFVEVPVITFDEYCKQNAINKIDFIKLDVESYEPSVLTGARETLTRIKPLLFMEYDVEWFNFFPEEQIADILKTFDSLGYKLYRETKSGELVPIAATTQALRAFRHLNILAIPAHLQKNAA